MTIKTRNIADGAVTSAKLAAGAVVAASLGAGSVAGTNLAATSAAVANAGLSNPLQIAVINYSVGADGSPATATLTPSKNFTFPINAIIYGAAMQVNTLLTSTAVTVSVGFTAGAGAATIQAAAVTSGAPWSTTGLKVPSAISALGPTGAFKLTAAGAIMLTASTTFATIIAGNVDVYIWWTVGTA